MKKIYLDYAAATPMDKRVVAAMEPYFSDKFHNPSALYSQARQVSKDLGQARSLVARWLGAKPAEIIFTAGATEANNLAIDGFMQQHPGAELLTSAVEHDSVLAPAGSYPHRRIPVAKDGLVDPRQLSRMISDRTVLVSVMMVNNETGAIQPLAEIAAMIKSIRQARLDRGISLPLIFHSDAAQAGNYLNLQTARLGVDLLSINGGKIYGPKQAGALYVKAGISLRPLIRGGGQESGLRSGTENVAAAIGLATALDIAQTRRPAEAKRVMSLRQEFEADLRQKLPAAIINGGRRRAPHLVSLTLPGFDNERLMMELDELGVQVAIGSACSASSAEPSHVLAAMGLSRPAIQSTLRLSVGRPTTKTELSRAARLLHQLAAPPDR